MNGNFSALLSAFIARRVKFLVVGGYAVMEYTEPRYTKDLDVWVATDPGNAEAVYAGLADFGAPLDGLAPGDFASPGAVYQIGVTPVRIDVLMSVEGVEFEDAWPRREERLVLGMTVPVISREDLITNKKAVNRPQDRIDVRRLQRGQPKP